MTDLESLALRVRAHVIRMSGRGGCFIGASLSCVDLLVHLYSRVLREGRDHLLLSKGHDVPALYGVLAELGRFPVARLDRHLDPGDSIYWHPSRNVPGVEFHSGSLGHLLSVGMGIAYDHKLRRSDGRVYVVLGDGELNEGSVWEALLVASALKLDNLVPVVDRNGMQANCRTEELVPLEPLADKLAAFGWTPVACDGHDFASLGDAFDGAGRGGCTAIVARTLRGKGCRSLEDRVDRWFASFTPEEVERLLGELHGGADAALTTEGTVVR